MRYDCFISYASADIAHAEALHRRLVAEGFNVWFDRSRLDPGCDWHHEIEEGCRNSRVLLPLLTPRWKLSEWTRKETYVAENVIPLLVEGKWEDVSTAPLARYQSFQVPASDPDHTDWRRLFNSIREICSRPEKGRLGAHKPTLLPYDSIGSLFKGRDEFLALLRDKIYGANRTGINRIPPIALHGLGGIGKTRVAVEYARAHRDEFTALLFIGADSPATLETNIANLCGAAVLDLPEKEATDSGAQLRAVLRWLEAHQGWFLIFDNVDTEEAAVAVEDLLARLSDHGQILITTRISRWSDDVEDLHLDVINVEDAADYLISSTASKRTKSDSDQSEATKLATVLGQLPLALTQAAAYIREHGLSFAAYLNRWNDAHDKVIRWSDRRQMKYPMSVAVTWETSFEQLSDDARELLRILSWFAPDPIPNSLLEVPIPDIEALPSTSPATLEAAAAQLNRYSLITRDHIASTFSIHRLVQDVTRTGMPETNKLAARSRALCWIDAPFDVSPYDARNWPLVEPLAPHAEAISQDDPLPAACAPAGLRILSYCASLHEARARFSVAEPLYRRALAIVETSCNPLHPDLPTILNNLAGLLADTNRLAEAEPMYRRALAIDEDSYGTDHPVIANRLNNLAQLLTKTSNFSEAETMYRRALAILEASNSTNMTDVATCLSNLAQLLCDTDHLNEAEDLLRRALEIDEASYGPNHHVTARDVNNLAEMLREANNFAAAEPLYRRALQIVEDSFGPDHPRVATCVNNLALMLASDNRQSEAAELFRRALEIDEATYGADHPVVANRLNNLAGLLADTNHLAEAELLYRRALAIDEASYGQDHPDVATDLNNLALLLSDTNRTTEAEPLYHRALAIYEASYGPNHRLSLVVGKNLACLTYKQTQQTP